jgi:hypothetical protein
VQSIYHDYEFVLDYIAKRRRTVYDFWTRTQGLQIDLYSLPDRSLCYYSVTRPGTASQNLLLDRISPDSPSAIIQISDLKIGTPEMWQPLVEWLEPATVHGSAKGISLQKWWDDNGMVFRFMDMPVELRMCVYEQISGPYL